MATGIVAIAARLNGLSWAGTVLFVLNLFAFVALWVLLRLWHGGRALASSLADFRNASGLLTIVADTCVVGR